MKILLLNENPVVSRLISLSAKKMSYEFEELNAYDENLGHYDVIIVDSDTPAPLKILKDKCERLIFLAPRNQNIDIDVQILQKPFLPTDFLSLLNNENIDENIPIESKILNNNENPYADINLDLDSLNLDDLSDEDALNMELDQELENLSLDDEAMIQKIEVQNTEDKISNEEINLHEEVNEEVNLNSVQEIDEKEDENIKIQEESLQIHSDCDNLEEDKAQDDEAMTQEIEVQNTEDKISNEEINLHEEVNEEVNLNSVQEIDEKEDENIKIQEESLQIHSDCDNLEEDKAQDDEILNDNKELKTSVSDFDDLPIVEEQEKEINFDDIPEDAEFLGQEKNNNQEQDSFEDFMPVVEEEVHNEVEDLSVNLSTQEQIKEELAQLDELECDINEDNSSKVLENFKDEPILNDNELGINEEEVVAPRFNDFDALKESDIQEALGEKVSLENKIDEKLNLDLENNNGNEIVNELSQSIAGAITSSIKDDTLKAALKGMNMNININISFKEDN